MLDQNGGGGFARHHSVSTPFGVELFCPVYRLLIENITQD
jgi:hypothetical protein